MTCTSANTQLDSLLYPRDERSATWAFPCCDLAPFGGSESCTHVHISHNNTPEALQTACPIHTLFSRPSTQLIFVSHWQIVFSFRANSPLHHSGTGFSTAGPFSILVRRHCDMSSISCISRYKSLIHFPKRSFHIFTGINNMQMVDKQSGLQLIVTFNTVVWVFIHRGCKTPPCALAFPSFLGCKNVGAPGLLQQSAGLTANTALCHGVH